MSSPSSLRLQSEMGDHAHEQRAGESLDESDHVSQASEPRKVPSKTRTSKPAEVNYRYRKLLNKSIEEAVHGSDDDDETLPSGYDGGSWWTYAEKERLLRKLSSVGLGDLGGLASAVPTKSLLEIQSYLLLLRRGVEEVNEGLYSTSEFSLADVPAAVEVADDVDATLERAATILDGRLRTQQDAEEETRYEDRWLITQNVASEIDAKIGECSETEGQDTDHYIPPTEQQDRKQAVQGAEQDDQPGANTAEKPPVQNAARADTTFPSASLLRPATMLELSRLCFMGPDREYTALEKADPDSAPAIYRTAFDDLHSLTVSITRRVVQATLFQTMTRLRAKNNASPTPHVRTSDVHAAVEILGMQSDRKAYWAHMPRRCGVTVYTEAEKYADGRPATKHGVKLKLSEIEVELGLPDPKGSDPDVGVSSDSEDELHAYYNDSDAWTEPSFSEPETFAGYEEVAAQTQEQPKPSRKRKRALSPASHVRAEDAYLEALDQQASRMENKTLRKLLRMSPSGEQSEEETTPEPPPPAATAKNSLRSETRPAGSWRDVVEYEASWEQVSGIPASAAFARMGEKGAKRRKKRTYIEQRLRSESHDDTMHIDESDEVENEAFRVQDADDNDDEFSADDNDGQSDDMEGDSNGET